MNDILISKELIYYNSNSRTSGEINSHETILDPSFKDKRNGDYVVLEMVQFYCKQSYYNISGIKSKFIYSFSGRVEDETTITLDDGNYNTKELANEIKNKLNSAGGGLVWSVLYDSIKMKFVFSYTNPGEIIVLYTAPYFKNIGESFIILGFSGDQFVFNSTTEISTNQISIGNLDAIFIYSDMVNNSYNITNNKQDIDKIYAIIPINYSSHFGLIYWQKTEYAPYIRIDDTHNILKFEIKDESNNLIELENDYIITFEKKIYKKNNDNIDIKNLLTLLLTKKN